MVDNLALCANSIKGSKIIILISIITVIIFFRVQTTKKITQLIRCCCVETLAGASSVWNIRTRDKKKALNFLQISVFKRVVKGKSPFARVDRAFSTTSSFLSFKTLRGMTTFMQVLQLPTPRQSKKHGNEYLKIVTFFRWKKVKVKISWSWLSTNILFIICWYCTCSVQIWIHCFFYQKHRNITK